MKTLNVNGSTVVLRYIYDDFVRYSQMQRKLPVAEKLLTPPEESRNIIEMLNNDCLEEFLKYLDFDDLCTTATTCYRLYKRVHNIVNKKHPSKVFARFGTFKTLINTPLWRTQDFLRNFGVMYRKASVANTDNISRIELGLMSEYCKNLKELWMCVSKDTNWNDFQGLFGDQSKVEILKINGHMNDTLPSILIPRLTKLRLDSMHIRDHASTRSFFMLNYQLKTLVLNRVMMHEDASWVFRPLIGLTTLFLRIEYVECAINNLKIFLAARIPLENIILMIEYRYNPKDCDLFKVIGAFGTLKLVQLYDTANHKRRSTAPRIHALGLGHLTQLRAVVLRRYADGLANYSFMNYP